MSLLEKIGKLFGYTKKQRIDDAYDMPQPISDEEIESNRQQIIGLLRSTRRAGIEQVIKYLDDNGFFIVPSSVHHHHNWKGGLAQHSLNVYKRAANWSTGDVSDDSLIIACLLHDICKADLLCYDRKGNLCRINRHTHGHGARSIRILERCHLDLLDTERRAIRWHMGGNNAHSDENAEVNRTRKEVLWKYVYHADKEDAGRKD